MRKRIYEIIEVSWEDDRLSDVYDWVMLVAIVVSIVPLAFKQAPAVFRYTDYVTTVLFILDYLLRWSTADLKQSRVGAAAFLLYPFTPWAIVDLLSILPTLNVLGSAFRMFRLFRMLRTFRVFRVFKALRYSKSFSIILSVVRRSKEPLLAVVTLAVGYILVSALVIFNVESQSFNSFFDAIYWATVSLTTVGYGDIYPVTTAGRVITMLSSLFGIAIVALPSGIITAGYINALNQQKEQWNGKGYHEPGADSGD